MKIKSLLTTGVVLSTVLGFAGTASAKACYLPGERSWIGATVYRDIPTCSGQISSYRVMGVRERARQTIRHFINW